MLCRALLTALAISYLICVLLLSGLQKEDLDVSMLRKLQRYNVNIDDMNNELQRTECLTRDKSISMGKSTSDQKLITTTREPTTTTTKDPLQGLNMETVLNYLITERKAQETTTHAKDSMVTEESYIRDIIESKNRGYKQAKIDINVLQRYINLNEANKTDDIVIIKSTVTPTDYGIIQNNLSAEKIKTKNVQDVEFMNKMFMDYLLQKQIRSTTIQYTTTRSVDMRSVYKKINEFIVNKSNRAKSNQERLLINKQIRNDGEDANFESSFENVAHTMPEKIKMSYTENYPIRNIQDFLTVMNQYKTYYPFLANNQNNINPKVNIRDNSIKNMISEEQTNSLKKKVLKKENLEIKTFQEFLVAMNNFKTFYPFLAFNQNNDADVNNNNNELKEKYIKQDLKMIEIVTDKHKITPKEFHNRLIKTDNNVTFENNKALSSDLVKEIAETVKDVIIKDLRKEISNINFKPTQNTTVAATVLTTTEKITTSTTSTSATTAAGVNKNGNNIAIVDKVMELFEQIKSMQQNTFMLKISNYSDKHTQKLPDLKTPDNPPFLPIFDNKLNQKPEIRTPILPINNYNVKQHVNAIPSYLTQRKYHPPALTIQTNSVEIQPLPVPISKPQSMINQNIIVPTHAFQSRDEHNSWHHFSRENRYPNIGNLGRNRAHEPTLKRHANSKQPINKSHPVHAHTKDPKHNAEDVIRFRIRNNGDSKFDNDYYEKISLGNYKTGANVNNEHLMYGNRGTSRFHERFENVDERMMGTPDNDETMQGPKDDDVPSRQQLSLTDMKKGSSYDDTHFKNFLSSQQKVTDILEKILASRPKTNSPRSVETT